MGVASSNAEAVQQVDELRPDFTLCDIDLGRESGFDLARELARGPGPTSPVILVSAHAEADFADLVRLSSAVGFISKTDLSAARIRDLLGSVSGDDAAERGGL